jgi:tRNA-splicing ligase RtcB
MDEAPQAYKDIRRVLAEQSELVEILATFRPRVVLMAPAGERAED